MKAREYVKAIIGALIAGLTALGASLADGGTIVGVSSGEWVAVVIALVGTFGGVYGVENKDRNKRAYRRKDSL